MKHFLRSLGLVAALPALLAGAQQPGHQHHKAAPKGEAAAKAPLPAPASPEESRSPFLGYRGFRPGEPLTDWKAANEAVRAAGGHIGLVKAQSRDREVPVPPGHAGHAEPVDAGRRP